jgi:hypothetical protein
MLKTFGVPPSPPHYVRVGVEKGVLKADLYSSYSCPFFSASFSNGMSENSSPQGSHPYCNFFSGVFRMGGMS